MNTIYVNVAILIVVLLGMTAIGKEIFQHFQKTRPLPNSELKWKVALFMLGLYLIVVKVLKIISIIEQH